MIRNTKLVFWVTIIGFIAFYAYQYGGLNQQPRSIQDEQVEPVTKSEKIIHKPLHAFIGKSEEEITSVFGIPKRKDISAYDYSWWVYEGGKEDYLQIGMLDGKVVSVFALGMNSSVYPFKIGQAFEEQVTGFERKERVQLTGEHANYEAVLTKEEQQHLPLIQIGNVWAQLYKDRHTEQLAAIRYLDSETLIKQGSYQLIYRGQLLEPKGLSEEAVQKMERGVEKQIFAMTNLLRSRYGAANLNWHEETAKAALAHSKDMERNNFFSHTSEKNGGLQERLTTKSVSYQSAGENIAAKYIDAPEVVIAWLNSAGHRESLLHKDFTHIGVGVYNKYYTQNFIQAALH